MRFVSKAKTLINTLQEKVAEIQALGNAHKALDAALDKVLTATGAPLDKDSDVYFYLAGLHDEIVDKKKKLISKWQSERGRELKKVK